MQSMRIALGFGYGVWVWAFFPFRFYGFLSHTSWQGVGLTGPRGRNEPQFPDRRGHCSTYFSSLSYQKPLFKIIQN